MTKISGQGISKRPSQSPTLRTLSMERFCVFLHSLVLGATEGMGDAAFLRRLPLCCPWDFSSSVSFYAVILVILPEGINEKFETITKQ